MRLAVQKRGHLIRDEVFDVAARCLGVMALSHLPGDSSRLKLRAAAIPDVPQSVPADTAIAARHSVEEIALRLPVTKKQQRIQRAAAVAAFECPDSLTVRFCDVLKD